MSDFISQQEAEALAKQHIQDYMNACHCATTQDAANVLMKLISLSGLVMCSVVGKDESIVRLLGTAEFIRRQPDNFRMEPMQ